MVLVSVASIIARSPGALTLPACPATTVGHDGAVGMLVEVPVPYFQPEVPAPVTAAGRPSADPYVGLQINGWAPPVLAAVT